jgi:hypothetical protein
MIGYHTASAYKLYNPFTKKVTSSRDVTFEEDKSWNWNSTPSENQRYIPFQLLEEQATAADTVPPPEILAQEPNALRRSGRAGIPNRNLLEYETILDDMITSDGDIVQLALYVDTEPLTYEQAAKYEE